MTNGSSQGLFVIVAVVIFGLFIAISYILFTDTLQPSLANIFNDTTEKSLEDLTPNDLYKYPQRTHSVKDGENSITKEGNNYIIENMNQTYFEEENNHYFGMGFGAYPDYKINTDYTFTFNLKLMEGSLRSLGGHMPYSAKNVSLKINEDYVFENETHLSWHIGTKYVFEKDKEYKISLSYNTGSKLPESYTQGGFSWLQPNRKNTTLTNYKIRVSNIEIKER